MAHSIAFEDRATVVFVWGDDGYQRYGVSWLQGKVGAKLVFRDREVMTLLLWMDFLPFPGETRFLAFLRANYLSLFPSCSARVSSTGAPGVCHNWWKNCGDTGPRRWGPRAPSSICGIPSYCRWWGTGGTRAGVISQRPWITVCARRHLQYFGYKLVLRCTGEGVPMAYDRLWDGLWQAPIIGNQGFMGEDGPRRYRETRHREHLRCQTLRGLITHVMAKMTRHTLKLLLRRRAGIDVQTFTVIVQFHIRRIVPDAMFLPRYLKHSCFPASESR